MLTVHHLNKSYTITPVLEDITFTLNPGERTALVGPNGCGKTTLLRILTGMERPDRGGMQYNPPDLRMGYLPQGLDITAGMTIGGYLSGVRNDFTQWSDELEKLASALANTPHLPGLQRDYDTVLNRIQEINQDSGMRLEVLGAFGLAGYPESTPVATLSGGQKTRLALAKILLEDSDLLLLDEPTNHLDLEMLECLEDWLLGFSGGALIVSHDRAFLDRVATAIFELDAQSHTGKLYPGNYTAFLERKSTEHDRQVQEYADQQAEIVRLKRAASQMRSDGRFKPGGKGDSGDKFAKGFFANRSKGTVRRARHLEQRIERLLTSERVDKPRTNWQMKLEFHDTPTSGQDVLMLEDLSVGYGDKVLLENLNVYLRSGARVVFTGANGSGKTTLLRTITGAIPPLQGKVRLGAGVKLGVMAQEQEDLDPQRNALETILSLAALSETDARSFLHRFLFAGDQVFTPIRLLSFGERSRLSLASLVVSGCNLLLLDEPINHLDIPSRSRFEQALATFEGTVLAVIHDRFFIQGFATEVWQAHEKRLHIVQVVV